MLSTWTPYHKEMAGERISVVATSLSLRFFKAADAADILVITPRLVFAKQNQEKHFGVRPSPSVIPREIFAEIKPALANPTAERWRIQEIRVVPTGD